MAKLTKEEKEQKLIEKRKKKWNETHKIIDGIDYKLCSVCNEWLPCNEEYFYKNSSNGVDGFNPYCKEDTKKKSSKWEKENPEKRRILKKRYDKKPESMEKHHKRTKKWRDRGKQKEYYQRKPELFIKYRIEDNKKHEISKQEWNDCKEYFNHECAYCGIKEEQAKIEQDQYFHKEHAINEGNNDLSNCIPSCRNCNINKWSRDYTEWYTEDNKTFDLDRLNKINKWLQEDYKLYIKSEITL